MGDAESWRWDLQGVTVVDSLRVWTVIDRRRILWGVYEWEKRDKTESWQDEFGRVMLEDHWREWKVKKQLLLLTHQWSYRSISEKCRSCTEREKETVFSLLTIFLFILIYFIQLWYFLTIKMAYLDYKGVGLSKNNVVNSLLNAECLYLQCQDVALQHDIWALKSAELMTCNMMPQGGSNVYIKN